jgi:hypothetical protein
VRFIHIDEDWQKAPPCDTDVTVWRLGNQSGRTGSNPELCSPSIRTLTKETAGEGWHYLVLKHGSYCVALSPSAGGERLLSETNLQRPVYYLVVPAEKHVIYAGTVAFNPKLKLTRFRDETEGAKHIGEQLADFGEPAPSLFVPYDDPGKALTLFAGGSMAGRFAPRA